MSLYFNLLYPYWRIVYSLFIKVNIYLVDIFINLIIAVYSHGNSMIFSNIGLLKQV